MNDNNPVQNIFQGLSDVMMKGKLSDKNEWWQSFRFPETPNFSVGKLMNCARSALFSQAMMGGSAVHEGSWSNFSRNTSQDQIIDRAIGYIAELDGKLIYHLNEKTVTLFFIFGDGAILVKVFELLSNECQVKVKLVGTTKAHMQFGKELLDTCIKEKD